MTRDVAEYAPRTQITRPEVQTDQKKQRDESAKKKDRKEKRRREEKG